MTPHVLVINSGSSSVKYRLLDMERRCAVASGLAERIGESASHLVHHGANGELTSEDPLPNHEAALRAIIEAFDSHGPRLEDVGLAAVGHRVVHGGRRFQDPTLIDDEVVHQVRRLISLAPLHNAANLEGIEVARRLFPEVPQIAVFDTAFHQTLPPAAYTYAVPLDWMRKHRVRRYGFHGTSHAYVSRVAAGLIGRDPAAANLIVLHLGNGASASAVRGGKSVDTSMGLTPLEGLVMGTRSGDVDPALVLHMRRIAGLDVDEIDRVLNWESGLRGLAGDNDMREITKRAADGDADAQLAIDVYCYRIRKYVGAYYAVLGRVDAIAFTAGIGENSPLIRKQSLDGLERLGIVVDEARNEVISKEARVVSPDDAEVAVLVVPTDEEMEIAEEALRVARSPAGTGG